MTDVPNIFDFIGTHFLAFYISAIAVSSGFLLVLRQALISKSENQGKDLPEKKDPFFLSYLKSGATRVIKTALAKAVFSGKLENALDESKDENDAEQILFKSNHSKEKGSPPPGYLLENSKKIDLLISETEIIRKKDLQKDGLLQKELLELCSSYELYAKEHGLFFGESETLKMKAARIVTMLTLYSIGGVKLYIGIANERPILFLVILLLAVFPVMFFSSQLPRLTKKGKKRLEDAEVIYGDLQQQLSSKESVILPDSKSVKENHQESIDLYSATTAVSIFGLTTLGASEFSFLNTSFERAGLSGESLSGASCGSVGSSCGSSSCGGGGGCGGCGGCGS